MIIDCECGHPIDQHQTGEGAWTGFCWGVVHNDVFNDDDPCECERPVPAAHPFFPEDASDPGASPCRDCGEFADHPAHGGEVEVAT